MELGSLLTTNHLLKQDQAHIQIPVGMVGLSLLDP